MGELAEQRERAQQARLCASQQSDVRAQRATTILNSYFLILNSPPPPGRRHTNTAANRAMPSTIRESPSFANVSLIVFLPLPSTKNGAPGM